MDKKKKAKVIKCDRLFCENEAKKIAHIGKIQPFSKLYCESCANEVQDFYGNWMKIVVVDIQE